MIRVLAVTLVVVLGAAPGLGVAGSPSPQPVREEEAPTLTRVWNVPGEVVGSPATDGVRAYFLTKHHDVFAVDAASGKVRWRQSTGEQGFGGTGATVVISGSVVVVGDDNVLAFDRESGALRWRFVPDEGYGPGFYLAFEATATGLILAGSPSGRVYALDAETGGLRWVTNARTEPATTVYPPVVRGKLVAAGFTEFVAPTRGGIIVLDLESGRILWRRAFPAPRDPLFTTGWAGGPVFHGSSVIVSSGDGWIHAFEATTGAPQWTIPPGPDNPLNDIDPEHDFRGLAIDGGLLLTGSLTGNVVAYDLDDRRVRWQYISERLGSVMFRIAARDGTVFVPFAGGSLLALHAEEGRELWRVGNWTTSCLWPPARLDDLVIVSGALNGLTAYSWPDQ